MDLIEVRESKEGLLNQHSKKQTTLQFSITSGILVANKTNIELAGRDEVWGLWPKR